MNKSITKYTREEFLAMENFGEDAEFTGIVIVPTGELHDSGFGAMKFILTRHNEIVGAVSGWADVLHINGIGGYGKNWKQSLKTGMTKVVGWSIDCLPGSGCLRLFCNNRIKCRAGSGCISDFEFFVED